MAAAGLACAPCGTELARHVTPRLPLLAVTPRGLRRRRRPRLARYMAALLEVRVRRLGKLLIKLPVACQVRVPLVVVAVVHVCLSLCPGPAGLPFLRALPGARTPAAAGSGLQSYQRPPTHLAIPMRTMVTATMTPISATNIAAMSRLLDQARRDHDGLTPRGDAACVMASAADSAVSLLAEKPTITPCANCGPLQSLILTSTAWLNGVALARVLVLPQRAVAAYRCLATGCSTGSAAPASRPGLAASPVGRRLARAGALGLGWQTLCRCLGGGACGVLALPHSVGPTRCRSSYQQLYVGAQLFTDSST